MEENKESSFHINKRKMFLAVMIVIVASIFGVAYVLYAYPEITHNTVSIEKNKSIDGVEPVIIDFSRSVETDRYQADIRLAPAVDVNTKWENNNKKLIISPKTFWTPETQYSLTLPAGKSSLISTIDMSMFKFITVDLPKVTSVSPKDGAKEVSLDIEDPISIKFDKPLDDFFVKVNVEPATDITYQYNNNRTEFKLLPQNALTFGTDYKINVFVKYSQDKNDNYYPIYESSFTTEVPPVITWDKNFIVRLEQAKKYTVPKITTGKYIDINLKAQVLSTFEDGKIIDSFMISSGKPGMPTPTGEYHIKNKAPRVWSKAYGLYMPFWMAVASDGSFGIHELPEWPGGYKEGAAHLGTPVSHGCVRLGVGAARAVYDWTEVGTPVVIY